MLMFGGNFDLYAKMFAFFIAPSFDNKYIINCFINLLFYLLNSFIVDLIEKCTNLFKTFIFCEKIFF